MVDLYIIMKIMKKKTRKQKNLNHEYKGRNTWNPLSPS